MNYIDSTTSDSLRDFLKYPRISIDMAKEIINLWHFIKIDDENFIH